MGPHLRRDSCQESQTLVLQSWNFQSGVLLGGGRDWKLNQSPVVNNGINHEREKHNEAEKAWTSGSESPKFCVTFIIYGMLANYPTCLTFVIVVVFNL